MPPPYAEVPNHGASPSTQVQLMSPLADRNLGALAWSGNQDEYLEKYWLALK
jgi:hypothetical protein